LCNRSAEGVGLDVVRETAPAVDLDHGEPLPIFGLQAGIAGDVDLPQVEAELLPERGHDAAGRLAEVTARGVVEDDLGGYG
jgi:hypothetical protein